MRTDLAEGVSLLEGEAAESPIVNRVYMYLLCDVIEVGFVSLCFRCSTKSECSQDMYTWLPHDAGCPVVRNVEPGQLSQTSGGNTAVCLTAGGHFKPNHHTYTHYIVWLH